MILNGINHATPIKESKRKYSRNYVHLRFITPSCTNYLIIAA